MHVALTRSGNVAPLFYPLFCASVSKTKHEVADEMFELRFFKEFKVTYKNFGKPNGAKASKFDLQCAWVGYTPCPLTDPNILFDYIPIYILNYGSLVDSKVVKLVVFPPPKGN